MYVTPSASVSLSIFYAKQSWDRLLKYLLNSLICEIQQKEKKITFYLFFSEEQGEHVRIIFKSIESPERLRDICSINIKRFLQNNPSPTCIKKGNPKGVFMDFNNNTFYFNSFRPVAFRPDTLASNELESFQHILSRTMAHVFSRDIVSHENIFSFFLYMQIASLKIFKNREDAENIIASELSKTYKLIHPSKLIQFEYQAERILQHNEVDLLSILNFTSGDIFPDEWAWLEDWLKQCSLLPQDSRNLNTFRDLVFMIAMHIDFKSSNYGILSLNIIKRLLSTNPLIINH